MLFQLKQARIEGLIAQSLYESLGDSDRHELDRALASDPALRAEYDALRRLVDSIPASAPKFTPDLLPTLRGRLDVPVRQGAARQLAFAGLAALLVAGLSYGVWTAVQGEKAPASGVVARSGASDTLVEQALAEANGLLAKRELPAAYDVLRKALDRQPGDARAGEAQWMLAQCAFDLNRYADADDACTSLFSEYYPSLERDAARRASAIAMRDLLAEAKQVDFASLQTFDVAKRDRADPFAALEGVATTYAKYMGAEQYALGELVAKEMAGVAAAEGAIDMGTPQGALAAYQAARGRCTSPVAAALLDIQIGDAYANSLNDPTAAKSHYQRAAENPVLATFATKALKRLE